MKAEPILRAILENDLLPWQYDKFNGIFRVGEFLCVTNGHAFLALKSAEQPLVMIGINDLMDKQIQGWFKLKSKVSYCSFADLKAFLGPRAPKLYKCDKCDEYGERPCGCKDGACGNCDSEGMRNCECGYTYFPSDPVKIGSCVFNRYLLQVFTENLHYKECKFRDSTPDEKGGGDMMILGDSDWRLFVMPYRNDPKKTYPEFRFEDHMTGVR